MISILHAKYEGPAFGGLVSSLIAFISPQVRHSRALPDVRGEAANCNCSDVHNPAVLAWLPRPCTSGLPPAEEI